MVYRRWPKQERATLSIGAHSPSDFWSVASGRRRRAPKNHASDWHSNWMTGNQCGSASGFGVKYPAFLKVKQGSGRAVWCQRLGAAILALEAAWATAAIRTRQEPGRRL